MIASRPLSAVLPLVLLGLLTASGCGGQAKGNNSTPAPCEDDCGPGACELDGKRYDDGTSGIPAGDGCNTCFCAAGDLSCSEVGCPPDPRSCEYGGVTRAHGASFQSSDGCNSCACNDGQVSCTESECSDVCENSQQCSTGEVCLFPSGTCGGGGACTTPSVGCNLIYSPVCGCDGATYGNECEATANGVSVASTGECAMAGCGSCGAGEYCAAPEGQCSLTNATCTERPTGCDGNLDPVCGCDGVTYSNACEAASVGTNVSAAGACLVPCYEHTDCATGAYCAEQPGQCFVFTPATSAERPAGPSLPGAGGSGGGAAPIRAPGGFCQMRPTACGEIYSPVCGCDNVTYDNSCMAASAGVSVLREGEC